ncbi:MAG TPA: prolyl oligopeptidase family serine peptidase, partial [Urbifossiella sp.]|nr:prolyl oligopeptidase family serine peptidase [Urbifossiella sp.]
MFALRISLPMLCLAAAVALADGPADNQADKVRPVPPVGIELPKADADEIAAGLAELQGLIKQIGKHELLPDVEIYEKAVRYAVQYREVFNKNGIPAVKKVLKDGLTRARLLNDGKTPWNTQTGYVVRGYRSRIDGSPQPYGLFVPKEYDFKAQAKHRLDFWWHGRGETLSEVNFMAGTQNAGGIIPVPGQFILYPYGRYCCANKFAGEVDSFECLEHAGKHYRIDGSRLVARGFSMGGAACWQYAVHFPTLWCAAAPGAGFSETADFLKVFQKEPVNPPWYEQKLWRMYDCTDYALNIFNLPTVAYSGENDSQKQAADMMAKAMAKEGLKLVHIIGPGAKHNYEKGAKAEVNKLIDMLAMKGKTATPEIISFSTSTLRYNKCAWLTLDRLERHWANAEVSISLRQNVTDGTPVVYRTFACETKNVAAFSVNFGPGEWPAGLFGKRRIIVDNTVLDPPPLPSDRSMSIHFVKEDGKWKIVPDSKSNEFAKVHGLQGPIDDAFMDSFIMVKPSGNAGDWVK